MRPDAAWRDPATRRAWRWRAVPALIATIAGPLMIALAFAVGSASLRNDDDLRANGIPTVATVLTDQRKLHSRNGDFCSEFQLTYTFAGKEHTGRTEFLDCLTNGGLLKRGDQLTIYVDPDRPGRYTGPTDAIWQHNAAQVGTRLLGFVGVPVTIVGAVILIRALRVLPVLRQAPWQRQEVRVLEMTEGRRPQAVIVLEGDGAQPILSVAPGALNRRAGAATATVLLAGDRHGRWAAARSEGSHAYRAAVDPTLWQSSDLTPRRDDW